MTTPPASDQLQTFHAPPERLPAETILAQSSVLGDLAGLAGLLDCMPDFVMILNEQRQIIYGNRALRAFAGPRLSGLMLGLRPGELLNCHQAGLAPAGCGTGQACRTCGAVNAILEALAGRSVTHECRISSPAAEAHDLRIWASPFRWSSGHHVLMIAVDISNEKRRQVLERIFFHDILNTAGSIYGLSDLIRQDPDSIGELKDDLYETAESLVNEIRSQRLLLQAEQNELHVTMLPANSRRVLEAIIQPYLHHPLANKKFLRLAPGVAAFNFDTDATLLHRVLGNLVKNALEASRPGDTVELGADEHPDRVVLWCRNPQFIPGAVQLQMFQRSFTTKGPGRGIGTYSIRLLTERYLGGRVTLTSTPEAGTRFELAFPKK